MKQPKDMKMAGSHRIKLNNIVFNTLISLIRIPVAQYESADLKYVVDG